MTKTNSIDSPKGRPQTERSEDGDVIRSGRFTFSGSLIEELSEYSTQQSISHASAVVAAVERTISEFGGIDILVNNAGIAVMGPLEDFTLADFDRTLAVNVRAVFVATQAAVKHMKDGGRIINIGSTNAERMPFRRWRCLCDEQVSAAGVGARTCPRLGAARDNDQQCATRPGEYGNEPRR